MLTPIYLAVGHWLRQHADDEKYQAYSRTILWLAWSDGGSINTMASHPTRHRPLPCMVWLAATMVLTAVLWQQARYLWLMSLFAMMAATMWQGSRGAAPAEIALSWTLLAVLHVGTAVWLDSVNSKQYSVSSKSVISEQLAVASKDSSARFCWGRAGFWRGWPCCHHCFLGEQRLLLVYALGNWIGVNGWLAFVQNGRQHLGLQTLLNHRWLQHLPTQIPFPMAGRPLHCALAWCYFGTTTMEYPTTCL